jgi:hypothetical protein
VDLKSLGLLLISLLFLAAIAARVLWALNWFPPPRDWTARRKLVTWVVFVAGMAGFVLFVRIVWRR